MNEQVYFMLFYCLISGVMGYMLGNMNGYGKGLKTAARIWEGSYNTLAEVFAEALKREGKSND